MYKISKRVSELLLALATLPLRIIGGLSTGLVAYGTEIFTPFLVVHSSNALGMKMGILSLVAVRPKEIYFKAGTADFILSKFSVPNFETLARTLARITRTAIAYYPCIVDSVGCLWDGDFQFFFVRYVSQTHLKRN